MDPITLLLVAGGAVVALFLLFPQRAAEAGLLKFDLLPVDNAPVTQPFTDSHHAIDFGAPLLAACFNVASGTVLQVHDDASGDSGRFVIVKGRGRLSGVAWSYSHLADVSVRVGQDLEPGELIGLVGNSGFVLSHGVNVPSDNDEGLGAHLHFAVLSFPALDFIDPTPFLP